MDEQLPNDQTGFRPNTGIDDAFVVLECLFFFPPLLFSRRRSIDTGLFYWAASRHRLFLYWPVSRCACGREGVSPDLPLPG